MSKKIILAPALLAGIYLLAICTPPVPPQAVENAKTGIVKVPYWNTFVAVAGDRAILRAAQAKQESGFNPCAVSWVGAKGIGQFMPSTWREWGGTQNIEDPYIGIKIQHAYMNWLTARTRGDEWRALAGYNAGLGSVQRADRIAEDIGLPRTKDSWMRTLPRVTGNANSKQTIDYVKKITTTEARWKAMTLVDKAMCA